VTVKELINLLEKHDSNAIVVLDNTISEYLAGIDSVCESTTSEVWSDKDGAYMPKQIKVVTINISNKCLHLA